MNSYQIRCTNPLYNDVMAQIIAPSIVKAIAIAEDHDFDFLMGDIEIVVERFNVVDQLGRPYPELITIY